MNAATKRAGAVNYRLDNHLGPRAHHETRGDGRPTGWSARLWAALQRIVQRIVQRIGFIPRRPTDQL